MSPLQRPAPELPASRPRPSAQDAPTVILTVTLPARVMPPVTLPPPADATRVPETLKGTVLLAWQLPALGVKVTFQVPSKAPGLAAWAAATSGAALVARAAATRAHRRGLKALKWATKVLG